MPAGTNLHNTLKPYWKNPMSTLVNRPIPVLDPVNDGRHKLHDRPLARESMPYVIALPEHDLGTFIYTWVNKENIAGAVFVVYGPTVGDTPIVESIDGIDVGADANFDDWRVGTLHLQQDLKLQTAKIKVDSERIKLDVSFEALHPAYAYGCHPDGCPSWAATNRLEQAGTVRGTLSVDGKSYAVDTTSARDHSWGTRDWDVPQHWKWLHAQSGTDTAVHFWQISARGKTDLRGYVLRDGKMAEVASVDVDFTVDAQYRQSTIGATLVDTAGRTTRVTGAYFGHFPLVPKPSCTLYEGAMRAEIDGKPGVGWTEFMWPTAYLEHLRKEQI